LADAERVVRKEQQIMRDDEFPEDYTLTVFPFSRDVSMDLGLVLRQPIKMTRCWS